MTDAAPVVARVQMPEKGVFLVRCAADVRPAVGTSAIVLLDYGEDVGRVQSVAEYDPERHGAHLPGFQLLREQVGADAGRLAENEALAEKMRAEFLQRVRPRVPDLRIPYARLSFGRARLFLRFMSHENRPDLSSAIAAFRRRHGVSVQAWQTGLRDAVGAVGAVGPCGRACCCCTWQTHYPAGLTAEKCRGGAPGAQNGICGRFKCCLAFEDREACADGISRAAPAHEAD
ncbi:MAG: hypothetical protein ACI4Q3_10635 [Kiritimatiellia bacterium]